MEAPSNDADLKWLLIDSTVVQAHQHAAGKNWGKVMKNLVGSEVASALKFTSRSMHSVTCKVRSQ